jgi:hypothetical protein
MSPEEASPFDAFLSTLGIDIGRFCDIVAEEFARTQKFKTEGVRLQSLRQICGGCPSAWEGTDQGGRSVLIRYRWGRLSVRVAQTPGQRATSDDEVWGASVGDSMAGVLDIDSLRVALPEWISLPGS